MADYDPAVVRSVLREHGHEVPRQGRLGRDYLDMYEAIVSGPPVEAGEYDEGISADLFSEADLPPDDEAPQAPVTERKPRRVRQSRPSLTDRLRSSGPGRGGSRSKAKRKHPRVPVDRLTGRLWEALGRVAATAIPPVGKAIQWQAPVAGLVFEDMARDTVVDRALQPLARAEAKAEMAFAIVGLPVIVGAITAAQGLPDDQRLVREAFLVPLLRECLAVNIKIMGDRAEEMAARQEEMGPVNAAVDKAMALIFAPPMVVSEDQQRMAAEDAKVGV